MTVFHFLRERYQPHSVHTFVYSTPTLVLWSRPPKRISKSVILFTSPSLTAVCRL
nr:MAG TPA: hypothetical protein [Caudoviricetes sp.]